MNSLFDNIENINEIQNTISALIINNRQFEENMEQIYTDMHNIKKIIKKFNMNLLDINVENNNNKKIIKLLQEKNNKLITYIYILLIINFLINFYYCILQKS